MSALDAILEEIRSSGPISFARFMELALYHPVHGYYQRGHSPIGFEGDYFTSPHIHRAFALCLARQILQMWQVLGQPSPFNLIEFGCGSGKLAAQLLEELSRNPEALGSFRYLGVETSKLRRDEAVRALVPWTAQGQAIVVDTPPPAIPEQALVLANEFLDALPFHRVVCRDGRLMEIYIDAEGDTLIEREGSPQPAVQAYFAWLGRLPPEGSCVEVNLGMLEWVKALYGMIPQGYVLVIDYGYTSDELYGKVRPKGTALAYFKHQHSEDLLARPGNQDITAHVDFSALSKAAQEAGFQVVGFTTQAFFLANLGIGDAIAQMLLSGAPEKEVRATRLAVAELVWPYGLGGFKVLALGKQAPTGQLTGFSHSILTKPH